MRAQVYSLAQQQNIDLKTVIGVVDDQQTLTKFYKYCISMFPVVLSPMSAAEMNGQRNLTDWHRDRGTLTDRYYLIELMRLADQDNLLPEIFPISADKINFDFEAAPLLATWQQTGLTLFGRSDFGFRTADTLRRPVAHAGHVIGGRIHDDMALSLAYRTRAFSIMSICADAEFHENTKTSPWWSTHWHDMRSISLEQHQRLRPKINDPEVQGYLRDNCPAQPIPSGHHVLMPTWMLHAAGGQSDTRPKSCKPADYTGIKAYISHVVLERPLGTLRHPATDCCYD